MSNSNSSGLAARAAAVAQIVVADLEHPEPNHDDHAHLAKVLRVRPGEVVVATDGQGSWRLCEWTATGSVEASGDVRQEPQPNPRITIGFCLLKGDRNEWVVQKLTELGIDRIVPLHAARSVIRWDEEKTARNVERFARIAYEAAMQSRRVWLPEVSAVQSPANLLNSAGNAGVLADFGGACVNLAQSTVVIGPEGGWAPQEAALGPAVDLGPTVLRADTASLVAGALLCTLRHQVAGG